jgi:hypothetical protein
VRKKSQGKLWVVCKDLEHNWDISVWLTKRCDHVHSVSQVSCAHWAFFHRVGQVFHSLQSFHV